MRKAVAIFRRDVLRLLHNPIALMVVLGLCVVPCLYAWINVYANWDPYANTSDISVAVVNQDRPVEIGDMGAVCVGDMVVESLESNDQIGWIFVDEDDAVEGVRSGAYYAALILTPDFTGNLAGVLEGRRDKAQITYLVNEKVNAIAPKVTDAGASTIERQIDDKFVAAVSKVLVEKLQTGLGNIQSKTNDSSLGDGSTLEKVRTVLAGVDTDLGELASSLTRAGTALSNATDTIARLQGVGNTAQSTLDNALSRLTDVRTKANNLIGDLNKALGDGAQSLSALSTTVDADLSSIAGELSYAQAQVASAISTLESGLTDSNALASKVSSTRSLITTFTPADANAEAIRTEIARQLDAEADILAQISGSQAAKLEELRALAQRIQAAADEVAHLSATFDGTVQSSVSGLLQTQAGLTTSTLMQISSALDSFAQVSERLRSALSTVDPIIQETVSTAEQLVGTLNQTADALEGTRSSLSHVSDVVDRLSSELDGIRSSQVWSALDDLPSVDASSVQDFMSAPVEMEEVRMFPVDNYASGVAPFFTSLALWVGGIALIALIKLEVDEEGVGRVRPWQAYFGRWLMFVVLGTMQAIVCCTGDLLIGIQCAHPWAFYLSAIVASFAFINVIFALAAAFKHIGKALAFTLIILQVPGSAGTYPIEMMPDFFNAINPWLPFTYSNNAMREAVAGIYGSNLVFNLCMLLLFVVPSLLVGVTARSHLVNVNALFDKRLRETDHLMVSEPVPITDQRFRLATVVKAVLQPEEYRETFEERSEAFMRLYPSLRRRGVIALFLVPLALFGLMLVSDAKLVLLACWVVSLVFTVSFLVVIEYFRDRVDRKMALTDLPPDELQDVLNDTLRDELLPMAPIDTILEKRGGRSHGSSPGRTTVLGGLLRGRGAQAHDEGARDAGPLEEDAPVEEARESNSPDDDALEGGEAR